MQESSFDYIKELIKKTHPKNLNEADTRHRIIDELLHKVLSWPRELVDCESFIRLLF